jgi:hypothetical protein
MPDDDGVVADENFFDDEAHDTLPLEHVERFGSASSLCGSVRTSINTKRAVPCRSSRRAAAANSGINAQPLEKVKLGVGVATGP